MISAEVVFALLALSGFAVFVISTEEKLANNFTLLEKLFSDRISASECAVILNSYYANSGGEAGKEIGCIISGNTAIVNKSGSGTVLPKTTGLETRHGKMLVVKTNGHYK